MRKIFYVLYLFASLSLISCSNDDTVSNKRPAQPTSDESDMPWNRPEGPEGAGALGILNQQ